MCSWTSAQSSPLLLQELILIVTHISSLVLSLKSCLLLLHFKFPGTYCWFILSQSLFLDTSVKWIWNNNSIQRVSRQGEAITEPRPFHNHALPINCIKIIRLLTATYSCYFLVMQEVCCQSMTTADRNLIHRIILQFLLMPITYPGSLSQSEHNKMQYFFSILSLCATCFVWPSIHT